MNDIVIPEITISQRDLVSAVLRMHARCYYGLKTPKLVESSTLAQGVHLLDNYGHFHRHFPARHLGNHKDCHGNEQRYWKPPKREQVYANPKPVHRARRTNPRGSHAVNLWRKLWDSRVHNPYTMRTQHVCTFLRMGLLTFGLPQPLRDCHSGRIVGGLR